MVIREHLLVKDWICGTYIDLLRRSSHNRRNHILLAVGNLDLEGLSIPGLLALLALLARSQLATEGLLILSNGTGQLKCLKGLIALFGWSARCRDARGGGVTVADVTPCFWVLGGPMRPGVTGDLG